MQLSGIKTLALFKFIEKFFFLLFVHECYKESDMTVQFFGSHLLWCFTPGKNFWWCASSWFLIRTISAKMFELLASKI